MLEKGNQRVLVIAPHSDDESIGCGGMIARARYYGNEVKVVIATVGDTEFYHLNRVVTATERVVEAKNALKKLAVDDLEVLYMDKEASLNTVATKERVSKLDSIISSFAPTMVFIPYPSFHQDHKVLFEASFAALRPSPSCKIPFVAMYEYPFVVWNYEQLNGGKMYFDITQFIEVKIESLLEHKSQIRTGQHMISPETVKSWAAYRGLEASVSYAELYHVLRHVV